MQRTRRCGRSARLIRVRLKRCEASAGFGRIWQTGWHDVAESGRSNVTCAARRARAARGARSRRSEEHTSELQSLMRISYAVFCLKKKTTTTKQILHWPKSVHTST